MKAGLIGTVRNVIAGEVIHAEHTTPEAKDIFGMLTDLRDAGVDNLVMEVSSQGLKLDRVYGIRFKCACFTNLYEDHIAPNEHPDMEDYMRCKLKIFDNCEYGIINTDCEAGRQAAEYCRIRRPQVQAHHIRSGRGRSGPCDEPYKEETGPRYRN